ncbi:hypothetical protein [Microbacterium sp. Se63.02b]|uniref:hypothetical protein n=1 Tax=Microbacterium sp. Se63.02b TaxID=2709304 RepID=UPI0016055566|nr:hypothetical protein [Microbacterium sp. Se63.02b]
MRNAVLTVVIALSTLAAALAALGSSLPVGIPAVAGSATAAPVAIGAVGSGLLIATAVWSIVRASGIAAAETDQIPRGAGAVLLPGTAEVVDVLAPGARARLLLFVSPGCHACATAIASLDTAEEQLAPFVDVYVIQRLTAGMVDTGSSHSIPASARFALDIGGSLDSALEVGRVAPVGALIGTNGSQAGPLARGSDDVAVLIDSIRALADVTPA